MIILSPTASAQSFYTRCRSHSENKYLFVLSNALSGVQVYVQDLTYSDGIISGNIDLPLSADDGRERLLRIFSVDSTNETIIEIESNGGESYSSETWTDTLDTLTANGGIEKEIYRGLCFITSQTDLDKYSMYG